MKMLIDRLMVILLVLGSSSAILAFDSRVGNGSDLIHCRTQQGMPLKGGDYSLDYVFTYQVKNKNKDIIKVKSWEKSIARIKKNFSRLKNSYLLNNLNQFVRDMKNTNSVDHDRSWKFVHNRPAELDDEKISEIPFKNCLKRDGTLDKRQFIYRLMPYPGSIVYKVNQLQFKQLKKNRPLQFSFSLIHEWLWDITDNIDLIRDFNYFVHSKKFDTINKDDFIIWQSRLKLSKSELVSNDQSDINTQLYFHVRSGNLESVKEYHRRGGEINRFYPVNPTEPNGFYKTTLLLSAIKSGNDKVVEYLINNGSFLNEVSNSKKITPLALAGLMLNLKMINLLIDAKADLMKFYTVSCSVLNAAVYHEDLVLIQKLYDYGAKIEYNCNHSVWMAPYGQSGTTMGTPMMMAYKFSKEKSRALLAQLGGKRPQQKKLHQLMFRASETGDLVNFDFLLDHDVSYKILTEGRNNLLHLAASASNIDVALRLIKAQSELVLRKNRKNC